MTISLKYLVLEVSEGWYIFELFFFALTTAINFLNQNVEFLLLI